MTFLFDAIFWAGFSCFILGLIGGACLSSVVRRLRSRRKHGHAGTETWIIGGNEGIPYIYDRESATWSQR